MYYYYIVDKTKKKKSSKDSKEERKDSKEDRRDKDKSKSDNRKKSDGKNKSDESKHSADKSDKVKEESEDLNVIKGRGVVTPGNGLKIHIKLERDVEKKEVDSKKRASTVKRLPGRFRSTGLEEEPDLQKKKPMTPDPGTNNSKRTGSELKPKEEEPPEKKSRLQLSTSLTPISTTNTVNTSPPITSPGDIHAKLKTIPPAKNKGMCTIDTWVKLLPFIHYLSNTTDLLHIKKHLERVHLSFFCSIRITNLLLCNTI